ncbi:gas vesicle protein K [Microbispora triticiradicis]|uniref:gas vesicle protein K n=1 Tax=Microbispora triticiradicis TaxID=2200763 RepID=UPI001FCBDAA8|nr:gas vesicle protein K [Microbispora triticiradicis]
MTATGGEAGESRWDAFAGSPAGPAQSSSQGPSIGPGNGPGNGPARSPSRGPSDDPADAARPWRMGAVPGTAAGEWSRNPRTGPDTWRLNTDPEAVRRDLSRLVLTLVELIRQLVERQCVRRMDQGDLSDEQIETLGLTLMRLEEAMTELCERFGLSPSDLNLDLGPLGTLLPTDTP